MPSTSDKHKVQVGDRVKTRSGRHGVVRAVSGNEVAHVVWDDGEDFPIRFCHLEVLAHGYVISGNKVERVD